MLGSAIRGFFLLGVLGWYSTSVWRTMDEYFRDEFKKYLSKHQSDEQRLQMAKRVDCDDQSCPVQPPAEIDKSILTPSPKDDIANAVNYIQSERKETLDTYTKCVTGDLNAEEVCELSSASCGDKGNNCCNVPGRKSMHESSVGTYNKDSILSRNEGDL